jgi:hypothetical protein
MKRIIITLTTLLFALALIACNNTTTTTVPNTAPTISGVQADVTIALGESFDALEGVTANDAEDGVLTSSIRLESVPVLVFASGIVTPDEQGEYYITYAVTDAGGLETKEFTTLTVTRPTTTETLYKSYVFTDSGTVDLDGWQASFTEGASGTMAAEEGRLAFHLENRGGADYHAKLYKVDVEALAGVEYELKITMSASVAGSKLHFIVNNAANGWSPLGGIWNLELSTTPTVYSIKYAVDANSNLVEYLLQMGGDLNPAGFVLYVDSVELLVSTGVETPSVLVEDDFTTDQNKDSWGIAQDASASSGVEVTGGALVHTISAFTTESKPWNINLYWNTGVNLESGKKYQLTFDVTTTQDQFYELCFEDHTMDWQVRAGFSNGTFQGSQTIDYTFYASMNITVLYIKLALGQGSGTNVLTIDNIRFVELVGDKTTESFVKTFTVDNSEAEWDTYNANGGVGALFTENDKLVYSIQSFGGTDWHNKMFIKEVMFEAGALYRIEFTVKADKELKMFFALNVKGGWDPRITSEVTIGTTDATFTFTMDAEVIIDMNFELLFQFGGYSQNVAPARIEFSAINIYQLK